MAQNKGTGKSQALTIAGVTITASDMISIQPEEVIGTVDGDGIGDLWADPNKTIKSMTITVSGYADLNANASIDTASLQAALTSAESDSDGVVAFSYYPTGSTTGNQKISGNAIMTTFSGPGGEKQGMMALGATLMSKGTITRGAA